MSRRRRLTMVGLCTVLAAGCGSGGSGSGTAASSSASSSTSEVVTTTTIGATSTTSPPRTTVTTRPAPAPTAGADRATAQRILFTAADVGMPQASPTNFVPIYARCGKSPLLPGGDDPRQASPLAVLKDETVEVRRLQTTALGAYAVLAPTEAAARSVMGTLRAPEFRACLEREFTTAVNGLVAGSPVTQGTSTADLPTPAMGDEVVAFRITVTRNSSRQSFEVTTVRKGRAIASIVIGRLGDVPFPDDERLRLARLLASRMP